MEEDLNNEINKNNKTKSENNNHFNKGKLNIT